jgi:Type II secretion system protein C
MGIQRQGRANARNVVSEPQLYGTGEGGPTSLPMRWKLVAAALLLVALALLALTLAHWGWRWFGPAPATIATPAPDTDYARRLVDAHLFGTAAAPAAPGVPATSANLGELRLLGIIVQRSGGGYALFRSPSRGPLLVAVGQEVIGGLKLEAIRPNGVTLLDGGVRRELQLRAAVPADKPRVATAVAATTSACAAPPGFSGPVVRLNAELLGGMMNTTDAWKTLVEPGAGALIVRDQSGFASNLGLRNGDRVESANGIALAIPADIPAQVLQPLMRSQAVWLAGSRDGKPQHWLYLNAGACPG